MSKIATSSFKVAICDLEEFSLELEVAICDLQFFLILRFDF